MDLCYSKKMKRRTDEILKNHEKKKRMKNTFFFVQKMMNFVQKNDFLFF